MTHTTKDLAWLAGLLEGEGSFTDSGSSVMLQVVMTDSDVIERAAAILGVKTRKPWKPKGDRKIAYGCFVCGVRAIGWMMTLYQFFGERRQRRIREIIEAWRAKKHRPHLIGSNRLPADCHPDRLRVGGRPICRQCWQREYMREWRKNGRNGTYYRQRKFTAA